VGPRKVRKENQIQKRRIAALEDYTCQLCGFRCEYEKENGKKGWIIHIDHIKEKADSGAENLDNLWALCPNCHAKKTCGILTIDPITKRVTERGAVVELLRDNHLFV
jgi:5-methylcytosine-specific restriction protein A